MRSGQGNGLSKFSNLRKFNFLEIHLTVKLIIKGNCVCLAVSRVCVCSFWGAYGDVHWENI